MDFGQISSDQNDQTESIQDLITALKEKQIMRSTKSGIKASKPRKAAMIHAFTTDDPANNKIKNVDLPELAKINYYSNEQVDDKPNLSLGANAKVDRWLNSRETPNEYAKENADYVVVDYDNICMASKANETASVVSTKSELRSKLLDKTAKVKQTLRNLTQNNN